MSLVGFTLLGSIEAPTITGAATGVPLLVKPNTEFTAAMLLNLDVGGGDLRFSSDAAGLSQLPCEIVDGLDVVWVKPTGVSISTGATLYVWGDNTGASQPAASSTYGRNAVWSDYHVVTTDGATDRTGNTTLTNANLSAGATFNGVQSARFNGVSSRVDALLSSISHPFAMSVWCDFDVLGDTIMGVADKSVTNRFHRVATSSVSNSLLAQSFAGTVRTADSGISPLTGGFRFCAGVYESASSRKITIDSSAFVTNTDTVTTPTLDRFTAGTDADSTPFSWLDGDAIYFKLYNFAPSQAYLDVEYDNQSELGSWWIASDAAGGISITESVVNSNYASLDPAILLTGSISVTESLVNANYAAINPIVTLTGSISITESIVNANYTSLNPVIDLTGIVSVAESLVNSNYISLDPVINLTSGAIEIIESTAGTQYAVFNPSILLTPEPLGIVSTVCFNGELVDLNYSGQSGILEFSGQLETAIFNGEFNALDFSGTIQTTCADGDIKTNC